jgi:hypothetical protein
MRSVMIISGAGLALCIAMTFTPRAESHAQNSPRKVLRHIVLYKFKDDLKPVQLQEVIDTFAGLKGKIETIIGFEYGTNVSTEGKSEGLTHSFMVTFRDEKGLQTYLNHPAHQDYVKVVRDRREKVIVFDYWASE